MGGMNRNSLGGAAQLSPYLNFDPSYLQVPFTNTTTSNPPT